MRGSGHPYRQPRRPTPHATPRPRPNQPTPTTPTTPGRPMVRPTVRPPVELPRFQSQQPRVFARLGHAPPAPPPHSTAPATLAPTAPTAPTAIKPIVNTAPPATAPLFISARSLAAAWQTVNPVPVVTTPVINNIAALVSETKQAAEAAISASMAPKPTTGAAPNQIVASSSTPIPLMLAPPAVWPPAQPQPLPTTPAPQKAPTASASATPSASATASVSASAAAVGGGAGGGVPLLSDAQLALVTAAFGLLAVEEKNKAELERRKREEVAAVVGEVRTNRLGQPYSVAVCVTEPEKLWRFPCPRCAGAIEMKDAELNCRIIRHGQLNPHADRATCEAFVQNSRYEGGCGAALRFENGTVALVGFDT